MAKSIQIKGPDGPLSGELVVAKNARDIVVIIPGSGPIDRNGNSARLGLNSDTYKLLAEDLNAAGVSSLRIDKRGFYGSAAAISDPNDVTIGAYAEDVAKWVDRASAVAPRVWLAGHSEGGLVALVAAQTSPKGIDGLILMATSGRPTGQLLIEQFRSNPANAHLMPDIESVVADLQAGHSRQPASLPSVLQPFFSDGLQRYMIDLFSYDPTATAKGWRGPALIVQGDADLQVKPRDADLLVGAMPQAVRVDLSHATHMLKMDISGRPLETYSNPELPLHPDLVPAIIKFFKQE